MQIAKPGMKRDKNGIALKDTVQDLNNFKINNPEEKDYFYTQDITTGYKNTSPNIVQEDNLNNSEIKPEQDFIFKRNTQRYNETRSPNNIALNNPEINNHNIKDKILRHNNITSNYSEVPDGIQRNISTEYIQDTTNNRKIPVMDDQIMVESIQKYLTIPIIIKDGVIVPYILQQTLPQEIISLDLKKEVNQPNLKQNHDTIQHNIENRRKHINNETEDMIMQDTLEQKIPQEIIKREFKTVNEPFWTRDNQEIQQQDRVTKHTQTHEDSEIIQQKISHETMNGEIKDVHQPPTTFTTQNIQPNLKKNIALNEEDTSSNMAQKTEDTTLTPQENMPQGTPNIVWPKQQNTQQKTENHNLKRQKRFISLFKRNEAQESENFLFKLLFFLGNRRNVVPIFTVMREINTLVKSNNGELNHVSKERNNYIGASPPVLTPVAYNLELGNENRVMVFIKRLLGLTPKGDRLSISGTGK